MTRPSDHGRTPEIPQRAEVIGDVLTRPAEYPYPLAAGLTGEELNRRFANPGRLYTPEEVTAILEQDGRWTI